MRVPSVSLSESGQSVQLILDDVAAKSLLALFRFAGEKECQSADLWIEGERMSEIQWRRLLALGAKLGAVLYPPTPC